METGVPCVLHGEAVGEAVVGHAWLSPGGLPELGLGLWRTVFLLLVLRFEVEVGASDHFLRFGDGVVRSILIRAQRGQLLLHISYMNANAHPHHPYQSLLKRHAFVACVDHLLLLERLLLAQLVPPRLQQLLVGTVSVQRNQLNVLNGPFFCRVHQLFQQLPLHQHLYRQLSRLLVVIGLDEVVQYFGALFDDEGDAPGEKVHEVWQQVGVGRLHELLDV